jgi:hypothetical protein
MAMALANVTPIQGQERSIGYKSAEIHAHR